MIGRNTMRMKNYFDKNTRWIYMGSVGVLLLCGFLLEWLVKGGGFWYAAAGVLLPVLPAAAAYGLEREYHLLDRLSGMLANNYCLPIALPIMLICYSAVIQDSYQNLNLYWSAGYLLCSYITYITMSDVPGIRCGVFLVQTLLFGYFSVYQDYHAGGSIAIAVLSTLGMVCMTAKTRENLALGPVSVLTLVCMMLCVVTPVFEKFLYSAISQQTAVVLDSFRNLLPHVRVFGRTALNFVEYDGLMFGHQLGYLLARFGWGAAVPVALALIAMTVSGFWTAVSGRSTDMLTVGCHILLVLRLISALLFIPGLFMGLCDDIPFLGGDTTQRVADCLLCAVVLLPMAPAELEDLNPRDPDFEARELSALQTLHHNRIGLTRLCRYVFDNPHTPEGWLWLFDKFYDLMDENTLCIMARNADAVLPLEVLGTNFLNFLSLDKNGEFSDLPKEKKTQFTSNDFLDEAGNYRTKGVFLTRYVGMKERLLIPPFWLAIGDDAMADNPCLQAVSVPNTVLRICKNAFRNCSMLTCAELRKGLIAIDEYAFCGTGLTRILLPPTLESLGVGCFRSTALQSAEIPGTVREVPQDCFADNPHLEEVVLEEGVCTIGPGAFRNCSALRYIHIPDSIRNVHPTAFDGCLNLVHVETAEEWKERSAEPLVPILFPTKKEEN